MIDSNEGSIPIPISLRDEEALGGGIVGNSRDPSCWGGKGDGEGPHCIGFDIPRLNRSLFDCEEVIYIIGPDPIIIRVSVVAF